MFSTGPESKGIETAVGNETDRQFDGFSTGPESKGIETGRIPLPSPGEAQFSTGPESKGIATAISMAVDGGGSGSALALTAKGLRRLRRTKHLWRDRSALALKAKGLRPRAMPIRIACIAVQHWP